MKTVRGADDEHQIYCQAESHRKRGAEYVQRIDETPVRTTNKLMLAMVIGKFTAEDVIKSIENARCKAQLVSVKVSA